MAHSTPAQVATATSVSSNAAAASCSSSSSVSSSSGNRCQLHQSSEQPKTVASAILKRRVEQRQRFDSADHALTQSAAADAAANLQQQQGRFVSRDTMSDEQEPEPEAPKQDTAPPSPSRLAIDTLPGSDDSCGYPQQNVRRIRLQRFDSADWVMDALPANSSCRDTPTQTSVAKLILDRHAYTTCHFVTTPVEKRQRCAEKAEAERYEHARAASALSPKQAPCPLKCEVIELSVLFSSNLETSHKMISGVKKHALVVLIAALVATYQMYRLESQRTRRGVQVEEEFERATRFLQSHLSFQTSAAGGGGGVGKYEVRVTQALHGKHKSAIVINRAHTVPRIEAELFVDQQLVTKRKQQPRNHKKPRKVPGGAGKAAADAADASDFSVLRLRVYDHAAMDAIAKTLQQKKIIDSYDPCYE